MAIHKLPFGTLRMEKLHYVANRGRPRKIPTTFASEEERDLFKQKESYVNKDPILKALKKDPSSLDVIDVVMREFMIEARILGFERDRLSLKEKDTSALSQKRLTALRLGTDVFFRKKELVEGKSLDLKSAEVQRLIEFLLRLVRECCDEVGLSEEMLQVLFTQIADRLDHIEPEMKAYIMDNRKRG